MNNSPRPPRTASRKTRASARRQPAEAVAADLILDDENDEREAAEPSEDDLLMGEETPLDPDADAALFTETRRDGAEHEDAALPVPAGRRDMHDSLSLYLREVSRFPLLTPEEEYSLARRVIDHQDTDAAFRIVSSHLRLVVKIAMDFQRRWMQNVLDLIQEGNVGLMRAVHKFDPEKGIKFSYYAAFWVKAYILKFIMDNWRMVKIGTTQAQRKLFYNLNKERQRLIAQGFDPDAATLSRNLNVTEEQVLEMQQRMDGSDLSLDAPVGSGEDSGVSRIELLPALGAGIEDTLSDREMAHMVRERIKTIIPLLSEKETYILQQRLLTDDPVTLREIGEKYGITRERVRQIEARLLQKVRDHLFREIKDFSKNWITQ